MSSKPSASSSRMPPRTSGSISSPCCSGGSLTPAQRWGVAIASAFAARNERLRGDARRSARGRSTPTVIEDAKAAASLMGMNNVYYRFRT